MIIHTFDQKSTEWENIRKGKITASVFTDLISPAKLTVSDSIMAKKTIAKIIANKVCRENTDDFQTFPMAKGTDCEPRARQLYQKIKCQKVREVGFIEHESGYAGFSPDGLVDGGMIEIKTQCQKEHFYCKLFGFDEWLKKYKPQILFSMAVCNDIQFCDCISYNEDFNETENKIIIYRYERNEEEVAKVREVINHWINFLKSL
jgi:hypothetical protein